ncbi:hypothetical protein [Kaistella sp.]|uniref:hypothetical protein n=1 Tax=Kaistella sp. TaxID=2782235 RepID=UPI003C472781
MKKISIILVAVLLSSSVFAQEGNSFSRSFNNANHPAEEDPAGDPGGDGDIGGDDSAPIDDYIPLLALAGVGMAVYFGRKKYVLAK